MKVMERNTTRLREELHQYINQADDRFVQLVYAMAQADKQQENNPALLASIERGLEQSKKGEGKPHAEVMRELRAKYSA